MDKRIREHDDESCVAEMRRAEAWVKLYEVHSDVFHNSIAVLYTFNYSPT